MEEIYTPKVRLQADVNGPLRGGERYQFGFYDAGTLRQSIDGIGFGGYKVYTIPVPNTELQFQ